MAVVHPSPGWSVRGALTVGILTKTAVRQTPLDGNITASELEKCGVGGGCSPGPAGPLLVAFQLPHATREAGLHHSVPAPHAGERCWPSLRGRVSGHAWAWMYSRAAVGTSTYRADEPGVAG